MSDLTSADFDRLDQLSAMLAAIPKVAAAGRKLLSVKHQTEAMTAAADIAKAAAEAANADAAKAKSESKHIRAAIASDQEVARAKAASLVNNAQEQARAVVDEARAAANGIMDRASKDADAAKHEAATIRATIADKRAECDRLDAKAAKIREHLKKMIGD